MSQLEILIRAFADPQATTQSVARAIGTLGDKEGGEYPVKLSDSILNDVRIRITREGSIENVPSTVVVYPSLEPGLPLLKLVPSCSNWEKIPGNPKASPFLYACTPQLNLPTPTRVIAQLTAAIEVPNTRVTSLVLQR